VKPHSMWEDEKSSPWLIPLYLAAFFGTLLCSHLFARLAA